MKPPSAAPRKAWPAQMRLGTLLVRRPARFAALSDGERVTSSRTLTKWALVLWLCVGVNVAQSVRAEAPKPSSAQDESAAQGAAGPRVKLGYHVYSLHDRLGGGIVHAASFSGFFPTRFIRAGGGVEAGVHAYDYGGDDGLLSGNLFVGYQHLHDLGPVVPYLVAVGELGLLFQKRYHTPLVRGVRGMGLELGADVKLVRSLHVGVGLTFMLYTMDDLAYDTFGLRLSIGL
jgi:hypothetical protein